MKSCLILFILSSNFCFGHFEDNSQEEFDEIPSYSEIQYFEEFECNTYSEPEFDSDGTGQPGEPNGVPIEPIRNLLLMSGILIGIVFLMKMKA